MSLGSNYNTYDPLFDFNNNGGVLFPYFPMSLGQGEAAVSYIDFSGSASDVFAFISFPMRVRLVTCEAFAVSDGQATKSAACTVEPIIGIGYATADLTTAAPGTEIAEITCDLTGDIGKRWAGTTTATTISTDCQLSIYLKTAAATSSTSTLADGGCVPVLWFAVVNSPA